MLDINPEIVCLLIGKLREFHAKEEVTIPEVPGSPSDDWARQVLADHVDDFSYQEIVETVSDLEPIQQVNLVALLWLGRGDYELEEWDEIIEEAKAQWTPRTAEYLTATPLVADYLQEGLQLHGHSCEA
jgi:hypothetical protein